VGENTGGTEQNASLLNKIPGPVGKQNCRAENRERTTERGREGLHIARRNIVPLSVWERQAIMARKTTRTTPIGNEVSRKGVSKKKRVEKGMSLRGATAPMKGQKTALKGKGQKTARSKKAREKRRCGEGNSRVSLGLGVVEFRRTVAAGEKKREGDDRITGVAYHEGCLHSKNGGQCAEGKRAGGRERGRD